MNDNADVAEYIKIHYNFITLDAFFQVILYFFHIICIIFYMMMDFL